MIVHLSCEAERDLESIGDYIARDNPMRAISFLQELRIRAPAWSVHHLDIRWFRDTSCRTSATVRTETS